MLGSPAVAQQSISERPDPGTTVPAARIVHSPAVAWSAYAHKQLELRGEAGENKTQRSEE
jgi:hypothetical protein